MGLRNDPAKTSPMIPVTTAVPTPDPMRYSGARGGPIARSLAVDREASPMTAEPTRAAMNPPPGELCPRQKITRDDRASSGPRTLIVSCSGMTFGHASWTARYAVVPFGRIDTHGGRGGSGIFSAGGSMNLSLTVDITATMAM